MAAVELTITGVLYDKLARTSQNVVLIGEASLTGLGVGGGPLPPGSGSRPPSGPVDPGYGYPEKPVDPGYGYPERPVDPGYGHPIGGRPHPEHPIYYPPMVPPSMQPPTPPNPGDPTTPVPPPEGSQGWPVTGIVPPPYIVVQYPGIGPVTVAPPLTAQPK